MLKKLLVAPAVIVGTVASLAAPAFAHECYNASRSTKGNEGAAESQAWFELTLEMLFTDAVTYADEYGLPPAELDDVPAMVADAEARGVPSSFVLLERATAMGGRGAYGTAKSSDGRAIDHFFTTYFPDLVAAYECGAGVGDCATT